MLPLAAGQSLLFGHALVSLPFARLRRAGRVDAERAEALDEAQSDSRATLGVDHLELRNVAPRAADWPRQDCTSRSASRILPDVEANMLAIPRKQRAMVRKGIKRGLRSEIDADVDRFFALYADNVHRHGTPALSEALFRGAAARCSATTAKC